MVRIPDDVIRQVKQSSDIVEVIGQYVSLVKRGQNYTCSCPFHEDRNPSFSIQAQKQIFKCFSCGRGGDVFNFIMEMEQVNYPQAIEKVAELSGVSLDIQYKSSMQQSIENKYQVLYDIHEKVAQFYHYCLLHTPVGEEALAYLTKRQFSHEILTQFQLGFSPNDSDTMLRYLENEGFSIEQLVDSGIFYLSAQQKLVDRFQGRVMFPLKDAKGRIVAFSGRIFSSKQDQTAKYLNSPETSIFKKQELLYHYDVAQSFARQTQKIFVTEGYFDVMRMVQCGINQVVATMGTSLTQTHLFELTKRVSEVYFVFDGDEAGQKAIRRAFELSRKFVDRVQFKAIMIPNQMDPDEWLIRNTSEKFQHLVDTSVTEYEFEKQYYENQYDLSNSHQLAQFIDKMIEYIALIPSPIEQSLHIQTLCKQYSIQEALVREQLANRQYELLQHSQADAGHSKRDRSTKKIDEFDGFDQLTHSLETQPWQIRSKKAYHAEKLLLQLLMYFDESWKFLQTEQIEPIFFHDEMQQLYFLLEEWYYERKFKLPMDSLTYEVPQGLLQQVYTTLLWDTIPSEYHDRVMKDCLKAIEQAFLEQEMQEWREKLAVFQRENRSIDVMETMNYMMKLAKQLKQ